MNLSVAQALVSDLAMYSQQESQLQVDSDDEGEFDQRGVRSLTLALAFMCMLTVTQVMQVCTPICAVLLFYYRRHSLISLVAILPIESPFAGRSCTLVFADHELWRWSGPAQRLAGSHLHVHCAHVRPSPALSAFLL